MVHKIKESGAFLYMIRVGQSEWRWGGGILKKDKGNNVNSDCLLLILLSFFYFYR